MRRDERRSEQFICGLDLKAVPVGHRKKASTMAKKKKPERNDALNELKTLESKWLKDHRLHEVEPIQAKVMAAKVAALLDFIEANELDVRLNEWPPAGAEDLVKMDRPVFEQGLT